MTRGPFVCAIVALALLGLPAQAQDLPVRVTGPAPTALTARVRDALASLGHRALTASEPAPPGLVEVRVEAPSGTTLAASVTAPARPPVRVEVDAREPEAEGLFALRVAEAVQAAMLPAPAPITPPAVVAPVAPAVEERRFALGVGARMLYAPGGVDAMVLPWVRASLGVPWRSVVWQVDVAFAGPSALGEVGGATLGAIEVSLGAGASLRLTHGLSVEAGARASFLALRLALAGDAQRVVRDGVWALSGVAALRWSVHSRVALRAGASLGATLGAVDLGIGAVTVAQWGRPLVGAEVGVEARF